MRPERIEMHWLRMPLVRPFKTSFGVEAERECLLISVEAEGTLGWGECVAGAWPGYSYETTGTALEVIRAHFGPRLLAAQLSGPNDLRPLWQVLRGHPLARAGLEMAVWDWFGRSQGRSLRQLLGGEAKKVSVGVSIGIQPSIEALLEAVAGYLVEGYPRLKLKIEPGHDVDVVAAVRAAHPEIALQVDANAAYSLDDLAVFEALDELNLVMIEQPLAQDDLLGHQRLQSRLQTPLCLDETIRSLLWAEQALDLEACRIINIKPGRVGGLSEAVRIHDACLARGVPVWCGGMLETGVGRASNLALSSLPGFTLPADLSASDRYYARDIANPRFELEGGHIAVPDRNGLGVEVDLAAVADFRLQFAAVTEA